MENPKLPEAAGAMIDYTEISKHFYSACQPFIIEAYEAMERNSGAGDRVRRVNNAWICDEEFSPTREIHLL